MNATKHKILVTILVLGVVLLAGCVTPPDVPSNTADDDDEKDRTFSNGVTVVGPTCSVDGKSCAEAEVTEFSIPKITVSMQNSGDSPARIDLNAGGSNGQQVLVSKCSQYRVKEFRADVSQGSSVRDVSRSGSVTLKPDETLDLTWFVELSRRVDATESLSCAFRFETSFTQQLTTVKQVQVRGSEEIARTTGLAYETSGGYPVELVIEAEDSTVQQIIGGEETPIQAKSYILNKGGGSVVSAEHSSGERIRLTIPGLPRDCSERQVRLTQGEQTTLMDGVLCSFRPERIESSQVYEVRAETTYDYVQQLPPVELSIHTLEAGG